MTKPPTSKTTASGGDAIRIEDWDYYVGRVNDACTLAANASDARVVSAHLDFARIYLLRLVTSVETQIRQLEIEPGGTFRHIVTIM